MLRKVLGIIKVDFDATGQTDHILCICQIFEKKYDYNEAVYQQFIDFKC